MMQRSVFVGAVFACLSPVLVAQESDWQRFAAADSEGVVAWRNAGSIKLIVSEDHGGQLEFPRIIAPVVDAYWTTDQGTRAEKTDIKLWPDQEVWQISWKQRSASATTLRIDFAAPVGLINDLETVAPQADGSVWLPAHFATTDGEKVRFEPQPYKNTVGYWTGKEDSATWHFSANAGSFNVSILQGCGRGQGGSIASLTVYPLDSDEPVCAVDFEVKETGHFQNFHWRHIQEIDLPENGDFRLVVRPNRIKKNALMDLRAVHLVKLPSKR